MSTTLSKFLLLLYNITLVPLSIYPVDIHLQFNNNCKQAATVKNFITSAGSWVSPIQSLVPSGGRASGEVYYYMMDHVNPMHAMCMHAILACICYMQLFYTAAALSN